MFPEPLGKLLPLDLAVGIGEERGNIFSESKCFPRLASIQVGFCNRACFVLALSPVPVHCNILGLFGLLVSTPFSQPGMIWIVQ